jgi:hypothetical protein
MTPSTTCRPACPSPRNTGPGGTRRTRLRASTARPGAAGIWSESGLALRAEVGAVRTPRRTGPSPAALAPFCRSRTVNGPSGAPAARRGKPSRRWARCRHRPARRGILVEQARADHHGEDRRQLNHSG